MRVEEEYDKMKFQLEGDKSKVKLLIRERKEIKIKDSDRRHCIPKGDFRKAVEGKP